MIQPFLRQVDTRYIGQSYAELTVPLPAEQLRQ